MKNEMAGQKPRNTKQPHVLLTGSTENKYPVMMDDRKTIIFISDKSRENEIRLKYMMREQLPYTR
jgi:hypothetical protein